MQAKYNKVRDMADENKVTVHGYWASPFVKRVEIALKIKGVPYEYVEEDKMNKSALLLQYNPVYKMVPVLVHKGKPIAESVVILEYIDETWKNGHSLLPQDPYKKAQVRFWANFLQEQLSDAARKVLRSEGETQEKILNEIHAKMVVLEEYLIRNIFPDGRTPSSNENNLAFLDIMISPLYTISKAVDETMGVKLIEEEKTPLLFLWITTLNEIPLVKDSMAPIDKLVSLFQSMRRKALQSNSS